MTELSRANPQRILVETRAALETPIDLADLEQRGVLERATDGWYTLLKPKALPPYAWQQVTSVRGRTHAMPMVKFNEPDDVERPASRAG